MQEEFRSIIGFEDYEISNLGRVKNLISGLILKNTICKSTGYYRIGLRKNCKQNTKGVHVLIARAFIPNPTNKPIVDHIDQDRANNKLANLRWVTHSQNSMNKKISNDNESGHSGVHFRKSHNRWVAYLMIAGERFFKTFKTAEEAIEYRMKLEENHFGVHSPNYKPPIIINNYITNNIQTVQTLINQVNKTEQQELEELEREFEQAIK